MFTRSIITIASAPGRESGAVYSSRVRLQYFRLVVSDVAARTSYAAQIIVYRGNALGGKPENG